MPNPTLLSSIGLIVSAYAVYVEHRVAHPHVDEFGKAEEEFKALCDIEAIGASCSQVFALPEGKMLSYFGIVPHDSILDVPNAALGMIYYTFVLLYSTLRPKIPLAAPFVMSVMAMASSVFLAYKLLVLKELCVVCWTTHVLNSLLLWHYGRRMAVVEGKETVKSA